ncbi:MAG: preprotein translocase subunit YajC, partial [Proteobacteria bacterium]|nr:preprotein translocase subunit YajC [Pseudomonadota bacterium]
SPAYAQAVGGGFLGGGFGQLLPLILIFAVFYFLLIRPQQRKAKMHREMLAAIRRGDKVVTGGGIMGTVAKVLNDHELSIEIAEGIRVRVQRGMIAQVMSKTAPGEQAGAAGPGQPGQQQGGSMLGKLFGR